MNPLLDSFGVARAIGESAIQWSSAPDADQAYYLPGVAAEIIRQHLGGLIDEYLEQAISGFDSEMIERRLHEVEQRIECFRAQIGTVKA